MLGFLSNKATDTMKPQCFSLFLLVAVPFSGFGIRGHANGPNNGGGVMWCFVRNAGLIPGSKNGGGGAVFNMLPSWGEGGGQNRKNHSTFKTTKSENTFESQNDDGSTKGDRSNFRAAVCHKYLRKTGAYGTCGCTDLTTSSKSSCCVRVSRDGDCIADEMLMNTGIRSMKHIPPHLQAHAPHLQVNKNNST